MSISVSIHRTNLDVESVCQLAVPEIMLCSCGRSMYLSIREVDQQPTQNSSHLYADPVDRTYLFSEQVTIINNSNLALHDLWLGAPRHSALDPRHGGNGALQEEPTSLPRNRAVGGVR